MTVVEERLGPEKKHNEQTLSILILSKTDPSTGTLRPTPSMQRLSGCGVDSLAKTALMVDPYFQVLAQVKFNRDQGFAVYNYCKQVCKKRSFETNNSFISQPHLSVDYYDVTS